MVRCRGRSAKALANSFQPLSTSDNDSCGSMARFIWVRRKPNSRHALGGWWFFQAISPGGNRFRMCNQLLNKQGHENRGSIRLLYDIFFASLIWGRRAGIGHQETSCGSSPTLWGEIKKKKRVTRNHHQTHQHPSGHGQSPAAFLF